ncbi:MAG: hypothetical protein EZS28_028683 [Streblomastix strix]|uniref:Uncharacterized protein n=1 Tax=Streblomastix strix TaxID=222440 RepID=A0A5J4V150_9EUKA|nr:MAG: hypothetical protein EZS28_028683 [Streblomastix strix]
MKCRLKVLDQTLPQIKALWRTTTYQNPFAPANLRKRINEEFIASRISISFGSNTIHRALSVFEDSQIKGVSAIWMVCREIRAQRLDLFLHHPSFSYMYGLLTMVVRKNQTLPLSP